MGTRGSTLWNSCYSLGMPDSSEKRAQNAAYREKMRSVVKAVPETKRCCRCSHDLPAASFYRSSVSKDGLQSMCKGCQLEYEKARYGPGRPKPGVRRRRLALYGLTPESHAALMEAQGHACKICQKPHAESPLVVDHDHACCPGEGSCGQCVRGLLCHTCNRILGLLGDDPVNLLRMVDYLASNRRPDCRR